jgi:type II secretory ATPase GspE/PulE/Tfp pilus assembly ATPase PilB-like protein
MMSVVLASIPNGPYINGYALLPVVVVLLIWAKLMTWMDKDAPLVHLPRQIMNAANFTGLVAAVLVFLLVPLGLWASLAIFIGFLVVELGVYLGLRHQKVGSADLIAQLKGLFESRSKKEKEIKASTNEILIINKAGVPMSVPDAQTPERVQFDAAQLVLGDAMRKNAERIEMVSSNEGASVTYLVDGFPYDGPTLDRTAAGGATGYLKFVGGLDMNEKRKPQTGPFKISLNGAKRDMQVTTKGSSSSESVVVIAEPKKRHSIPLASLGFSPEQLQTVKESIADGSGLVLLAVPAGHGLTALEYAIVRSHDAFLQHLLTIERHPEQDLEGVTQNPISPAATAAEEAKQVAWVVSQEPDAILMATIEDSNSARDLAGFAENPNKRAYVGLRSASGFDALRQWRKLVGDDTLAIKSLRMIIAGRTIRKLCEACKVGYTPDPTLLKKLNMDPAKVNKLFQARTSPMRDAKGRVVPCTFCNDLAFKGRVGVYEVIVIDEEMRQLILGNGTENQLKAAFRKQKGRYMQEMALDLVEMGETSVNEVQRVLRGDAPASGGGPAGGGRPTSPSGPKPVSSSRRSR